MANSTKPRAKPLPFWLALGNRIFQNSLNWVQNASQQLREQRVSHYQDEISRLETAKREQQKAFTKEVIDSFEDMFSKLEFKLTQSETDRIYEAASKDRDFHLPDWIDRDNRDLMMALYAVHDPTKLPKSMQSNEALMKQLQEAAKNWDQQMGQINQYDASIEKAHKLLSKAENALNPSTKPKIKDSLATPVAAFKSNGLDKIRMPKIFDYQAAIERKTRRVNRKRDRGLNQFTKIAGDNLDKIAQANLSAEDFGKLQEDFAKMKESNPEANYVDFMVEKLSTQLKDEKAKRLVNQIQSSYIKDTKQFTQAYEGLKGIYARRGAIYQETVKGLGELRGFSQFIGELGARLITYAQTKRDFAAAKAALKPKENVEARAR
jgi:hypothetical protein